MDVIQSSQDQWEAQQAQLNHVRAGTPIYLVLKWNFAAWDRHRVPPAPLTALIFQKYPPRLSEQPGRDGATAQPWRFYGILETQPENCKKILPSGAQNLPENVGSFASFGMAWKHPRPPLVKLYETKLRLPLCNSLLLALLSAVSCANAIILISAFFQALTPLSLSQ